MKKTKFITINLKMKNKNFGISIEDCSSEITFSRFTNFINKRKINELYIFYIIFI